MTQTHEPGLLAFDDIQKCIPALTKFSRKLFKFEAEAAQDLVQDTLLRAWQNRHTYDQGNFRGWLFSIMFRLFCDMKHRAQRRSDIHAQFALETDFERFVDPLDVFDVGAALQHIPFQFQEAVLLRLADKSAKETASILNIPVSTALTRYWRGCQKLRPILEAQLAL